ncbi:VOC family protein [Thermodesulfobacteriota bacterium]
MFRTPVRHVVIVVSDLKASLHFYRDILGWKVVYENIISPELAEFLNVPGGEGRNIMLQQREDIFHGMIELVAFTKPEPESPPKDGLGVRGLRMLSFLVNDLDHVYQVFTEEGVEVYSPPDISDLGDYTVKVCIVKDPDDVLLEIIEFLDSKDPGS